MPDAGTLESLDSRQLLEALRAFRKGDFTARLSLSYTGIEGEIAQAFNDVVELNYELTKELTRLGTAVGKEGKINQRARMAGARGGWQSSVDAVNDLIGDMTHPTVEVARVIGAVAKGDLTQRMNLDTDGRPLRGEFLRIGKVVNTMVDQLSSFAAEVTRVAREVGTEGKLGGQAKVKGGAGTWKDLTDNVNLMATNLTSQVRNIAEVTTAVARGDLSKKITVDVRGEILELKNTINTMVDQLSSFAAEVTRVAREVGTEGKLGGQARVEGVGGTWKDLTDNVNAMATNLTGQVRNIAEVTTAVARGDLTQTMMLEIDGRPLRGEFLRIGQVVNTMVGQLSSFAAEVTRVAREVGTEGKLGGQAQVKGVAGTWKDLTDNVNLMATNLTSQVRNIAEVTTAVANGDLSKKITVDVKGEILELKDTINTMVGQLSSFAAEVTRVAREVGTEGKLGGQAQVTGVAGTWKDLTDNVNAMATNLTSQVRNIAEVTTAVARGDLSKKITVDVRGEILELKNTINTMVDQLSSFAAEVTRVAREVGTEGKLGGQARVEGVGGTWKDLTDNVNAMATNLTGQVRNIAEVTTAVARGDLSKKITVDVKGEILELKDTINTMVGQLSSFASEVTRVAREVGTEGKLGGQAQVTGVAGTWKDLTDNVNAMATNLTSQVRNIAEVTTAVANGDLSKKITVDVKGEILELKDTINTMLDQLNSFASEVTRVAREVGTEGKLGGQAQVTGVAGTWKDLTDNVNAMATNLTGQVRGIADVVTAVACGDLTHKLAVDAKGEIAALADTINGMIDTLATFGDQVTNVAREVGIEGKLGGQARVPGAAGLWRALTDNVNQLAANLTTQVRAIAEVATAVTKGDLTRSITVEALGEVAALKDNINEMIRNLKDTTLKNTEQDWLKTNIARFTRLLQGERDLVTVSNLVLSELAPLVEAQQGIFYVARKEEGAAGETVLERFASYAFKARRGGAKSYRLREGLIGQCAVEKQRILLTSVPDDYVRISSGLGEAKPLNIVVLPVLFEGDIQAVIELASFSAFNETHLSFLDQLMESIGIVLNTIEANMRTEGLLKQSQRLTSELQAQQEELRNTNERLEQQAASLRQSEELLKLQQDELRNTNEELQEKARLLALEKKQVEATNREVEMAKMAVEEKAEQLALTSKYKSEFLANMSHELRTPLNSMLVLSKLLADNRDGVLTGKQVEFAKTIQSSGSDLLSLINDILDLSKIESGIMTLDIGELRFDALRNYLARTFDLVASEKGISFRIEIDPELPESIFTDEMRLQQILLNLLSNAFKFTAEGEVIVRIVQAAGGWNLEHPVLGGCEHAVEFAISDTGIGISPENQKIVFEAFQQADGSTNRRYGGTGLGLSISREISGRLGGEIVLESTLGVGSTFRLYLPLHPMARHAADRAGDAHHGSDRVLLTSPKAADSPMPSPEDEPDDRTSLDDTTPTLLIVSDNRNLSAEVLEVARAHGWKGIRAPRNWSVMASMRRFRIDAVAFDIGDDDSDGWALLDGLKRSPEVRHLPVNVFVAHHRRARALDMGAFSVASVPLDSDALPLVFGRLKDFVARPQRRLVVIAEPTTDEAGTGRAFRGWDVDMEMVTPEGVKEAFDRDDVDCVVIDLVSAPDAEARADFLARLPRLRRPRSPASVILAPHGNVEAEGITAWTRDANVTTVSTEIELVDAVSLRLHLDPDDLPEEARNALRLLECSDRTLAGTKVAIIDDDIRNIYSLTSVLEQFAIDVVYAEDGRSGIGLLREHPDVDAVLVDIMMPEMDGYETMKRVREMEQFATLPLIAVTAKAMPEDRDKCRDAGASGYLAKPVEPAQLISTLRAFLFRETGPGGTDAREADVGMNSEEGVD